MESVGAAAAAAAAGAAAAAADWLATSLPPSAAAPVAGILGSWGEPPATVLAVLVPRDVSVLGTTAAAPATGPPLGGAAPYWAVTTGGGPLQGGG